jgi:hypothetical protein
VFYEDLLQDREKCVMKIAEFAGIPVDDELKEIVMQQSSFQFMKVGACHQILLHYTCCYCTQTAAYILSIPIALMNSGA